MNWCYYTIVINVGFSSKLFALIAGYLIVEYSSWIIGLQVHRTCILIIKMDLSMNLLKI